MRDSIGLVLDKTTHELLTVPMSREFVALLAVELPKLGYANRSEFVRQAIAEKLRRAGVNVHAVTATAPTRMKLRTKVVTAINEDEPPEESAATMARAMGGAVAAMRIAREEVRRKAKAAAPSGGTPSPAPAVRRAKRPPPAAPARDRG